MRRKDRLRIGVDVDDVLYLCNQHAVDMLARDRNLDGLDLYDIDSWGPGGTNPILDERLAYFSQPDFVLGQPLIPGAQEFIKKLSNKGEVFFVTAVGSNCMNERARRLIADFPQVPGRNILIGARKDLIALDILLDDGAHNILGSCAKYPVLFRRPWNNNLTGLLAVNSYDDFLSLVDQIRGRGSDGIPDFSKGGIICLVGPSGSGKTELAKVISGKRGFRRPVTTTTRSRRSGENENYNFIGKKEFQKAQDRGDFLEFTVYGGQYYGCSSKAVTDIMDKHETAVMPIDICGAIAMKNAFPDCCIIVFTDRSRRAVLRSIINMDCPEDEKVLRILSLDSEFGNEDICDYSLSMDQGANVAADNLIRYIMPS